MARVFKQTYTKPLPAGAETITRKGQRLARFKDLVTVLDAMKEIGVHNLDLAAKAETSSAAASFKEK